MAGTVYLSFPCTRVNDYISNMTGTVYLSFPSTYVTDYISNMAGKQTVPAMLLIYSVTRVLGKDK
jgi:hypothetical protein